MIFLPGPILNDRLLLHAVDFKRYLNQISQPAFIVFIHRYESKGLLRVRNRSQHFGRAQQGARVGQAHQLDPGSVIQRGRQAQQSAGLGNDLQGPANSTSALDPQHCWG